MTCEDEFVLYGENFYFILGRDHQKISYECCDYESVDDNSLSWLRLCQKKKKKKKK